MGDAAHPADDGKGFGVGEDRGQGFGFFGADDVGGDVHFHLEDVAVEEEDGGEGLILGGGGDVFFSTARWVMKAWISGAPMSLGWRLW